MQRMRCLLKQWLSAQAISRSLEAWIYQVSNTKGLDPEIRGELEKKPRDGGVYIKAKEKIEEALKVANKRSLEKLKIELLIMCLDLMEELTLELKRCEEEAKGFAMQKKTL